MSKKYSDELKEQVVKEYLSGVGPSELVRKYSLSHKNRVFVWRDKYLECGAFPDGRGKSKGGGRPKSIDTSKMTKDEYIQFLKMENDILKQLRSLSNKRPR